MVTRQWEGADTFMEFATSHHSRRVRERLSLKFQGGGGEGKDIGGNSFDGGKQRSPCYIFLLECKNEDGGAVKHGEKSRGIGQEMEASGKRRTGRIRFGLRLTTEGRQANFTTECVPRFFGSPFDFHTDLLGVEFGGKNKKSKRGREKRKHGTSSMYFGKVAWST